MAVVLQLSDGRALQIAGESATIGRDEKLEVAFPSSRALEMRHARIHRVGARWYVEATGAHTIFVNGQSGRTFQLSAGDEVLLNPQGPGFVFNPVGVTAAPPSMAPATSATSLRDVMSRPDAAPQAGSTSPPPPRAAAPASNQIWLAATAVGVFALVAVIGILAIAMQGQSPSDEADPVEPAVAQADPVTPPTTPEPPPSEQREERPAPVDPEEFLVLTGLLKEGGEATPLVMGTGWLWDENHVVTTEVTGQGLKKLSEQSTATADKYHVCVVQGFAIKVDDVQALPQTGLAVLHLEEPAIAAHGVRQQWSSMSFRKANLALERQTQFYYASFRRLPRSGGLGDRQTPAFGYHPSHVQRETAPVSILQEGRSASFTQTEDSTLLEAGGLLLNESDEIIGVSLLDRTVVWSDDWCDRIAAATRQGPDLTRRGTQ